MIPKKIAAGIALAAALPLTLTACGGGGSDTGTDPGSTEQVTSLSILDYYNNDPDKQLVQKGLDTCAQQLGITINRETVPGDTLIAEGAAAGLVEVAARRADAGQPRHPADRRRPARWPRWATYGITADGIAAGPVARPPPTTASSTAPQPVTNTIAIFYNKDILAKAGVEPPKTWAELKDSAKKLTESASSTASPSTRTADYEGAWQFLPADVDQRRRRDRPEVPRGRRGAAAVEGPGRRRVGLQERRQLEPGRRERPVHRRATPP